jgi:hypothetical protein
VAISHPDKLLRHNKERIIVPTVAPANPPKASVEVGNFGGNSGKHCEERISELKSLRAV